MGTLCTISCGFSISLKLVPNIHSKYYFQRFFCFFFLPYIKPDSNLANVINVLLKMIEMY